MTKLEKFELDLDAYVETVYRDGLSWPTALMARKALIESVRTIQEEAREDAYRKAPEVSGVR